MSCQDSSCNKCIRSENWFIKKVHGFIPKPNLNRRSKLEEGISRTLEVGHSNRMWNDTEPAVTTLTALLAVLTSLCPLVSNVFISFYFFKSFALDLNTHSHLCLLMRTYGSVFLNNIWSMTENRMWSEVTHSSRQRDTSQLRSLSVVLIVKTVSSSVSPMGLRTNCGEVACNQISWREVETQSPSTSQKL